jgi:long-chain acyl-CoA synthetase
VEENETWAFDVDGTLVDSLTGTSLRPGTPELLSALRGDGCRIVWWSAGGADHARARAEALGVVELVDAFHDKGRRDDEGRFIAEQLTRGGSVVFVDDRPEDVPLGSAVLAVSPYLAENPHDRGLARALEAIAGVVT